jgi:hypothetical protein
VRANPRHRRTTKGPSDELLAARALHRRLHAPILRLAIVLVDQPRVAVRLTRDAIRSVTREDARTAGMSPRTAAVAALQRLATSHQRDQGPSTAWSGEERLAFTVAVLCDLEGHSHRSAAELLGTTPQEIARLHKASGAAGEVPARCAGWALVRQYDELSPSERVATDGHLDICRSCREAREERLAARKRLRALAPAGVGAATIASAWTLLTGGAATVGAPAIGGVIAGVVGGVTMTGLLGLGHAAPAADGGQGDRPGVGVTRPVSQGTAPSAGRGGPGAPAPGGGGPAPVPSYGPTSLPPPSSTASPGTPPATPGSPVPLPSLPVLVPSVPLPTALPSLPVPVPTALPTLPVPPPPLPGLPLPPLPALPPLLPMLPVPLP